MAVSALYGIMLMDNELSHALSIPHLVNRLHQSRSDRRSNFALLLIMKSKKRAREGGYGAISSYYSLSTSGVFALPGCQGKGIIPLNSELRGLFLDYSASLLRGSVLYLGNQAVIVLFSLLEGRFRPVKGYPLSFQGLQFLRTGRLLIDDLRLLLGYGSP